METTDQKMSLKLLIDTKANKVLFAEAGKDFVDFLFSLLSLPVGAVIKLLSVTSVSGCIANVHKSFRDLNESYTQPYLDKDILLNPKVSTSVADIPLLMVSSESVRLYACSSRCYGYATSYERGAICPNCRSSMATEIKFPTDSKKIPKGYVQEIITYMVSDNLTVTPLSMISSISMLTKCKISQLDVLEERVVEFGTDEGLELLKASFESEAALTAVFLGNKGNTSEVGCSVSVCDPE